MQTKREALHRLIKSTYLSTEKFAATLTNLPPDGVPDKLLALHQYLKKKEAECRELELEIDQEVLLEEQKKENEVALQIVDFLGRQGMVRTIEKLIEELHLGALISAQPYLNAKESIKKATLESTSDITVCSDAVSQVIHNAHSIWQFASLCSTAKDAAIHFCKQHRDSIPSKYLALLVLPPQSSLFRKLAEECSDNTLASFLSAEISKLNLNNQECMLYKRTVLGISGFTTPACKEQEGSPCPGCTPKIAKLSKGIPKSMRSTTRILCTKTRQLIPEDAPIFANSAGEVFCSLSISPETTQIDPALFKKLYRRCYFV